MVWGSKYDLETHYLRVFINRLRRNIEPDPCQRRTILTEPGVGYRLVADTPVGNEDRHRLA